MNSRKALFPGTFDPITKGHLDIIIRASKVFDELYIAISTKLSKNPLFSIDQRIEMVKIVVDGIKNVRVVSFNNLLIHYLHSLGITTIIRGLRAISDFEYEFQMALMNNSIDKEIDTIFFMTKLEYSFISSSLLKEIALRDGDISPFIPESIINYIKTELLKNGRN